VCNRALWFWEFAQNGAAPWRLRKSKRADLTENPLPHALFTSLDRKLIGILTVAMPECRPQPIRTSSILGWSETAEKPRGREGNGVAPGLDI
jgi:hypothetical protein